MHNANHNAAHNVYDINKPSSGILMASHKIAQNEIRERWFSRSYTFRVNNWPVFRSSVLYSTTVQYEC